MLPEAVSGLFTLPWIYSVWSMRIFGCVEQGECQCNSLVMCRAWLKAVSQPGPAIPKPNQSQALLWSQWSLKINVEVGFIMIHVSCNIKYWLAPVFQWYSRCFSTLAHEPLLEPQPGKCQVYVIVGHSYNSGQAGPPHHYLLISMLWTTSFIECARSAPLKLANWIPGEFMPQVGNTVPFQPSVHGVWCVTYGIHATRCS